MRQVKCVIGAGASPAANWGPGGGLVGARGDTLGSMAPRYYGDSGKAWKVRSPNSEKLKSDKSLQVGMKLKIPK